MTVSTKDIRAQLHKTDIYIDQLRELLEERDSLINTLKLTPFNADNLDVINLLVKIKAGLNYASDDLRSGVSKELSLQLSQIAQMYAETIARLDSDPYINIEEYLFKQEPPKDDDVGAKKSVRFKDFDSAEEEDDTTQMRNQLMGTSSNFKRYKDATHDPGAAENKYDADRNTLLSVDTSNQEMFAQHQQQMLHQDESLALLHKSIRTQHSIGLDINEVLDEHLLILHDLEQGVDGSHTRIRRATSGIASFRKKVQENGSLVTIIVLTVILILLLVVLN